MDANPSSQSIQLPKGGGAIRGIGEKFPAKARAIRCYRTGFLALRFDIALHLKPICFVLQKS